jgi:hypothetical protein
MREVSLLENREGKYEFSGGIVVNETKAEITIAPDRSGRSSCKQTAKTVRLSQLSPAIDSEDIG